MAPASTQRRVICVHLGSYMSASLLDNAGCGIRIDQQCAVRAVAACSAATCELAVRSRTRARAHSHRSLVNKAQSTDAPTAAARACRPGRVGVGYLWPDVEWERRHVAQVWCSDHHIIQDCPILNKPLCQLAGVLLAVLYRALVTRGGASSTRVCLCKAECPAVPVNRHETWDVRLRYACAGLSMPVPVRQAPRSRSARQARG